MAIKKFICPPTPASGSGTFSDDLVGFQLVQGGGLTQGNFQFTNAVTEKVDRTFYTGVFSDPINLENLGIVTVEQSKLIFENNFKVYPNFDLTQINNFVQYGSMSKRISTSVTKIISYFPAAIESHKMGLNYKTGATATNIVYDIVQEITTFNLDIARLRNPFDVDFTVNSTRNLSLKDIEVSSLRNLTVEFSKFSLYYEGEGYELSSIVPTNSLTSGILTVTVKGNPFSGESVVYNTLVIRPNDYEVNKVYNEDFDEVENFLLNRNQTPKYTCSFRSPKEADDGTFFITNVTATWPSNGVWNLDIYTANFDNYLVQLDEISQNFDSFKSNLISRFLTTGAFKDFDTIGQKMEKVLQIYGRSFDETNMFINALAFMNSVNYTVKNDIPSQLLKNLAQTLGWATNISPITNEDFLSSVFGQKNSGPSDFTGVAVKSTPDELNYQYYRNLVLNSAYLFVGHWMQGDLGEDRKNVGLLVKAFYETFKNKSKKPALILKTSQVGSSYMDRDELLKRIKAIKDSCKSTNLPNVYLLHGEFTDEEMNEIYNHSKVKAMVNLTKGEGFGRPLLEFSMVNKPIITTNWSGHIDYLNPEFTTLLPGQLTNDKRFYLDYGGLWYEHNHCLRFNF